LLRRRGHPLRPAGLAAGPRLLALRLQAIGGAALRWLHQRHPPLGDRGRSCRRCRAQLLAGRRMASRAGQRQD